MIQLEHVKSRCFAANIFVFMFLLSSRGVAGNEDAPPALAPEKVRDVFAVVLTPDGEPAKGAKIALGTDHSQVHVKNGDFDMSRTVAPIQAADETGRFRFPPQTGAFQVVVVHPEGYGQIAVTPVGIPAVIPLEPWAKVDGTFFVGKRAGAGAVMKIDCRGNAKMPRADRPPISAVSECTVGPDGRFELLRVVPGDGATIGPALALKPLDGGRQMESVCRYDRMFPAGETASLTLGGRGRAVIGRLQPPDAHVGKANWESALLSLSVVAPDLPPIPFPPQARENADFWNKWLAEWRKTEEGTAWFETYEWKARRYKATVDPEGRFRIDDVLPGRYLLLLHFHGGRIGSLAHEFEVADDEELSDEPLDLGMLQLQR